MLEGMRSDGSGIWSLVVGRRIIEALAKGVWWYQRWVILRLPILEILLRAIAVESILAERRRAV